MFGVDDRERVRERLIGMARADPRVESAAAVGGSAEGGDRWSDLDLTFGLAAGASMADVLAGWTRVLRTELGALTLFDLPFRSSIYRVFLLPGSLQVDLSFTPGSEFGPYGPRFALIFGAATEREPVQPPSPRHLLGVGVHHAVRGRICVERGRAWQAEYWISAVRDHALSLACLRHGLPHDLGRGFDQLPEDVRERAAGALVRSLARPELLRALGAAVDALLREAEGVHEEAARLEAELRDLVAASA
ncbi:MAG TPA: hypothetical protein VIC57_05040 [Candidatus Dormibacteraeota bacterium]|jgi:hypothetical protein